MELVAPADYEVPDLRGHVARNPALDLVLEHSFARRNTQADRCRSRRAHAVAAPSRVVELIAGEARSGLRGQQLGPAARAGVGPIDGDQAVDCRFISIEADALAQDRAGPFESERFEGREDLVGAARDLAGRVQVLDAYEPFAAGMAGSEVAAHGGNEGSEVQGTRRGRGETAAMARGGHRLGHRS